MAAIGSGRVKTRSALILLTEAHAVTSLYARIVEMSGATPNIEIMRFRL